MKNTLILFLCIFISLSAFAEGGSKTGNGGGGVLCRSGTGKFISLQTYDFFEATRIDHWGHLKLENGQNAEAVEAEAWERIRKYEPGLEAILTIAMNEVTERWKLTDRKIPRIYDIFVKNLPRGCKFVQLADWDDASGKIWVNRSLFVKMSPLQQVALKFHEAFYYLSRQRNGIRDSGFSKPHVIALFQLDPNWITQVRSTEDPHHDNLRMRVGVENCDLGKDYLDCIANWKTTSDYFSLNRFKVTLKVGKTSNPIQVIANGNQTLELSEKFPLQIFSLSNMLSSPNKAKFDFSGLLSLVFINSGSRTQPIEVHIQSEASGLEIGFEMILDQKRKTFSLTW